MKTELVIKLLGLKAWLHLGPLGRAWKINFVGWTVYIICLLILKFLDIPDYRMIAMLSAIFAAICEATDERQRPKI